MHWLKEHGVIGNYDDYVGLPVAVLEDCQMLMEHERAQAEKERKASEKGRP